MDPESNVAASEPEELEGPLSETVLCVRYKGTSNARVLNRSDLSGLPEDDDSELKWEPGAEIAWEHWVDMAGSEDRAREVLARHAHEFELVGPGAEALAEEEFNIGGVVE